MTFLLTLIGKNVGSGWATTIAGIPQSGAYYESQVIGPFLSGGSTVSFTVSDDADGACNVTIVVNAADF